MAGRSQIPNPTRSSTRLVSSVVRTVVQPPPPEPSCPGMSRLPRASGLRPPRSYGSAPAAPCAPQLQTPPPCRPRPPQGGSGIRPPQASGIRTPRASGIRPPQASGLRPPSQICRPPQRPPSPPRARSPPPAPCPAVSTPCAPAPCPAAAKPRESMGARDLLMADQSEEEAAMREALRAQWEATRQVWTEGPRDREAERRAAERDARAFQQQMQQEYARKVQARAQEQLRQAKAERELKKCQQEEECHAYNMTLEAIEEMLMEERDLMLREQQERMLRRAACKVCTEAQWRAAIGLADNWRREMLEAYKPYAEMEAKMFANKERWEKRKKSYRQSMRLPRPPLSPLRESQVDVFDDSPPRAGAQPMLPERVFDVPPPCSPPSLLDASPPWEADLPPPLLRSFTATPCQDDADDGDGDDWYSDFDPMRDPRRELTFDSEDDDSQLEGACGGPC